MRLNVWVPDELADAVRSRMPDVNVSRILQEGLRSLLKCEHERLVCADCAAPVDTAGIVDRALSGFYRQIQWELFDLMHAGGTCEGAARVVKAVAEAHQVSAARQVPLSRPPRGVRARREWDRRWVEEQQRLALE